METLDDKFEKLNDIPDEEIQADIDATLNELVDLQDEQRVLMRNRVDNRVRLYLLDGNIGRHQDLIINLRKVQDYRTKRQSHVYRDI